MLEWLTGSSGSSSAGLRRMQAEFGQMLDAGRHIFDTACNAFLGGTDLEVIRKDVLRTDKSINRAERKIRRELVVHVSVHRGSDFPACLVLMSIVKDAERLGDYGKNVFDLAELAPHAPDGEHRDRLIEMKDQISRLMGVCRKIFDSRDRDETKRMIVEAKDVEDRCDEQVRLLIADSSSSDLATTYVLAYRYFKRVVAHVRNVASSVVQPVHKIDFTSKITAEGLQDAADGV